MAKFRKKPVEIDAHQWTGDWEALDAWLISMGYDGWETAADDGPAMWLNDADPTELIIGTLEGDMRCPAGPLVDGIRPSGWWVIRGVEGEFYSCKPEIFAMTYESVDA